MLRSFLLLLVLCPLAESHPISGGPDGGGGQSGVGPGGVGGGGGPGGPFPGLPSRGKDDDEATEFESTGDNSMCWESTWSWVNKTYVANETGDVDTEQEEAVEWWMTNGIRQQGLPREHDDCYNRTTMLIITPLDLEEDGVMYKDEPYTFDLYTQIDLSQVDRENLTQHAEGFPAHVRLLFCDQKEGWCRPKQDTMAFDLTLEPKDTDVGATEFDLFSNNVTRWEYNESETLYGVDYGRGMIMTRWIQWILRKSAMDDNVYEANVRVSVQLRRNVKQDVHVLLAHSFVDFRMVPNDSMFLRVDVTDAVPGGVVDVKKRPKVLDVGQSVKIWVAVTSSLLGLIGLSMFCFVIYHRNHTVMTLAQGHFLASICVACLVQTTFSYTFLPTKDIHCKLRDPLTQIPAAFIAAVLIGRMWRVHATLSGVDEIGTRGGRKEGAASPEKHKLRLGGRLMALLDIISKIPSCIFRKPSSLWGSSSSFSRASLRRAVTATETATLIFVLVLPQLILQVAIALFYERTLVIEYNNQGMVGRPECHADRWTAIAGSIYVGLLYMIAIFIAWVSRNLPSAFSEKDQIFNIAIIGSILSVISIAMYGLTDDPAIIPDVQVFAESTQFVGLAGCVLFMIVWPKIRRVLSGKKVVMSTLLESRFGSVQGMRPAAESSVLGQRFKVQIDDPLPRKIERDVLGLQGLITSVVDKCEDGRPLGMSEWVQLRQKVARLKESLDEVDLEMEETKTSSE